MISDDLQAAGRRMGMALEMLMSPPSNARPCAEWRRDAASKPAGAGVPRGTEKLDAERVEISTIDYARMRDVIEESCSAEGSNRFDVGYEGDDFYAHLTGWMHRPRRQGLGDNQHEPYFWSGEVKIAVDGAMIFNKDGAAVGSDFDVKCI